MTKMKLVAVLATTLVALGACDTPGPRVECDVDDQVELDSDCGYFNANNQFVWYSWVNKGKVSYSPEGWQKPAYANHDENDSHKKKKIKPPKIKKSSKPTR